MIGDKIKERRLELGFTQAQLSKMTGIKTTTISNYENNISSPSDENIYKLMEALKCDANYLFEWDALENFKLSAHERRNVEKYRLLDKYGKKAVDSLLDIELDRVNNSPKASPPTIEISYSSIPASAGTGEWLDEEQLETISVPDTPEARKADVVIPVSGDSMEPTFSDGDRVLVRQQPAVEVGEIGVFIVEGSGYIKEFQQDRLVSHNSKYKDVVFGEFDDVRCVGKVLGKI